MTKPTYFKNFPNIQYGLKANKAGHVDYINITDYFKFLKVREDIFAKDTLYVEYVVQNGERPDQVSEREYGDEQFYWIILQINNIVDVYNQWPLSDYDLEQYIRTKYGSDSAAGEPHHYETVDVFDNEGNLVLPSGLKVTADFEYEYQPTPGVPVYLTSFPVAVSNFDYEKSLNEEKSKIVILDKKYVYDFKREYYKYLARSESKKSEIDISEVY